MLPRGPPCNLTDYTVIGDSHMTMETCTQGAVEAQRKDKDCPFYAFRLANETAMEGDCRCYSSCEAVGLKDKDSYMPQGNYMPGDPRAQTQMSQGPATTTTLAPEGETDKKGRPERRLWLALGLVIVLAFVVGCMCAACGCWCYFRQKGSKKAAPPLVADVVYGSPVNEAAVPAENQAVVAGSPIDPDDKDGMRSAAVVNLV